MGAIPSFSGREGEKALSDLQYKEGRKEPDFVLEMNLRQWMTARPRLLDPEVQPLLKRLHECARHVQSAEFGRALKTLAADLADCSGTVDLTEWIGESVSQYSSHSGNDIERKSWQEPLYFG